MTTGRINQVSRRDKQEPRKEKLSSDPSHQSKYTESRKETVRIQSQPKDYQTTNKLSYPYKYNRSATRELITRREKSFPKHYLRSVQQPKPVSEQVTHYSCKSLEQRRPRNQKWSQGRNPRVQKTYRIHLSSTLSVQTHHYSILEVRFKFDSTQFLPSYIGFFTFVTIQRTITKMLARQ